MTAKKGELPIATHEGTIVINGHKIKSYNLNDGQRVLSRIDFLRSLGRTGKAKGGRAYDEEFKLPVFLTAKNLKPFIDKNLIGNSTPILFKDLKGIESIGYKAELLPSVCYVFIDADQAGVLQKNQKHIADRCRILVRGFVTVGIVSLVDEATGFQKFRDKSALSKILEAYIRKEFLPWTKKFPDEFYEQLFRLKKWNYNPISVKRPQVLGKITENIVYKRIHTDVLKELKKLNPKNEKGNRNKRHHQFLTDDIGNPHLEKHIASLITLMRISPTWSRFMGNVERAFPIQSGQLRIGFTDDDDIDIDS